SIGDLDSQPLAREVTIPPHGVVTVRNPCHSGGTLEIFLEPVRPPLRVVVYGEAPIARAVAELAGWLGWDTAPWSEPAAPVEATAVEASAVVIASHGGDEASVLRGALAAGVPYVALVASRRRAVHVLDAAGLGEAARQRVHTPAGLDIGSRTPEEIALSILGEVMAARPRAESGATQADQLVDEGNGEQAVDDLSVAVDPVCGMTVIASDSTRHLDSEGGRVYFCGPGCEQAFRDDQARSKRQ
ncbi:MAG: XdhC family protein, partial [Acidimicrobiales bacterium]